MQQLAWNIIYIHNLYKIGDKMTIESTNEKIYKKTTEMCCKENNKLKVYPELNTGAELTTGAIKTYGSIIEVIPANTITSNFNILYIDIENASIAGTYTITLYKGASSSEEEIGIIKTTMALTSKTNVQRFHYCSLDANERISAKAACIGSANKIITISIQYNLSE